MLIYTQLIHIDTSVKDLKEKHFWKDKILKCVNAVDPDKINPKVLVLEKLDIIYTQLTARD